MHALYSDGTLGRPAPRPYCAKRDEPAFRQNCGDCALRSPARLASRGAFLCLLLLGAIVCMLAYLVLSTNKGDTHAVPAYPV